MKIRTGFVSNSSSSSFIIINEDLKSRLTPEEVKDINDRQLRAFKAGYVDNDILTIGAHLTTYYTTEYNTSNDIPTKILTIAYYILDNISDSDVDKEYVEKMKSYKDMLTNVLKRTLNIKEVVYDENLLKRINELKTTICYIGEDEETIFKSEESLHDLIFNFNSTLIYQEW